MLPLASSLVRAVAPANLLVVAPPGPAASTHLLMTALMVTLSAARTGRLCVMKHLGVLVRAVVAGGARATVPLVVR